MLQPGKGKAVVEFKNSADTIFHDNDPVLKNAPDVLRQWITMLNGRIRQGDSAFSGNSELFIETGQRYCGYKFVSANKKVSVYKQDGIHPGYSIVNPDRNSPVQVFPGMLHHFSIEEMLLLCVHDRELVEQGNDPLFSGKKLSSLILKKEFHCEGPVFVSGLEGLTPSLEKELNIFSREIQLLELRKMKKDRLQKETAHSSRNLNRLNRQHESAAAYRRTLLDIKKKFNNIYW